jgi:hypothetical protein
VSWLLPLSAPCSELLSSQGSNQARSEPADLT